MRMIISEWLLPSMEIASLSAHRGTTEPAHKMQEQPTSTGLQVTARPGTLCKKLSRWSRWRINNFGTAVAIDGKNIVVGADGDFDAGSRSGSAYIYRLKDGGASWDFAQKIVTPDAAWYDGFGYAVAIDGNYLVIGAPDDDDADQSSGSAHIYRTTDGSENRTRRYRY